MVVNHQLTGDKLMASKAKTTTAEQLNDANLAFNNSLNTPEILPLVAKRGYTLVRLTGLKKLLDDTTVAVNTKVAVKGDKELSTDQVEASYQIAHLARQDLASAARHTYRAQPAKLAKLGLVGEEPVSTAEFITTSYTLFDNAALPDIQPDLEASGYTVAFLAEERAKLVAFDQANRAQEAAKGSAEGGTADQNALLAQLHREVMDYRAAAKIALRDRPDLQEKIGIKVRNTKTAAKKPAKPTA